MTPIVPTVTAAVNLPDMGVPLTPSIVYGLAREAAIDLRDIEEVLETYKVPAATYEKLKVTEFFGKLVDAARIEWQSALNTVPRTQLEAAAIVEQAMPKIYARMVDPKEPLNHVVEAGKWLSDVAGLKKGTTNAEPQEKFTIRIDLSADTKEQTTLTFEKSYALTNGDPVLGALPVLEADDKAERV